MLSRYLGKGVRILRQAEDHGLFALYKPAGVVSHLDFWGATSSSTNKSSFLNSLIDSSCPYDPVAELFHSPDGPIHLLHRLDKDTSGIVLVSTDAKVAKSVRTAFRTRTVSKTYQSLSFGRVATLGSAPPPLRWEDQYIPPVYKTDKPRVFPKGTFPQSLAESSSSSGGMGGGTSSKSNGKSKGKASDLIQGGKLALTSVVAAEQRWISLSAIGETRAVGSAASVLERKIPATLLTLRPSTGFMHQLRVVLAARGFPIVGDQIYGNFALDKLLQKIHHHPSGAAGGKSKHRMFLHAGKIELSYLLDGQVRTFAANTDAPSPSPSPSLLLDFIPPSSSANLDLGSSRGSSARTGALGVCTWEADLRGLWDEAV